MIDPRYENPRYRGPELRGLTADEAFDLAKQFRIALTHKRVADRMRAEHERAIQRLVSFWIITGSLTLISGGLAAAMWATGAFQ